MYIYIVDGGSNQACTSPYIVDTTNNKNSTTLDKKCIYIYIDSMEKDEKSRQVRAAIVFVVIVDDDDDDDMVVVAATAIMGPSPRIPVHTNST